MIEFTTNLNDATAVLQLLNGAIRVLRESPFREHGIVRLPAQGRLLATGDLHDNPIHLTKIMRLAGLDKSPNHHVYVHELIHGENLINGMDFSHRMVLRAAELTVRYPTQFHPLLANHELAQFTGAGVSKGAGDSVVLFNDAVEWVYGDDSPKITEALNAFMRAWPIALRTENGLMCAHSLPSEHAMTSFDETLLGRDLVDADYEPRQGSVYHFLWGRRHSVEHLDRLAELFGVQAFCLGHEHAEVGWKAVSPRAIVLNSDHERAAVLPIDLTRSPEPAEWPQHIIPLGAIPE